MTTGARSGTKPSRLAGRGTVERPLGLRARGIDDRDRERSCSHAWGDLTYAEVAAVPTSRSASGSRSPRQTACSAAPPRRTRIDLSRLEHLANDLDLLRTHGPAPTTPTSAVLDRALSALRTEIERHPPNAAATVMTFRLARLRRRAFGPGSAAATVAGAPGAVLAAPSLLGVAGGQGHRRGRSSRFRSRSRPPASLLAWATRCSTETAASGWPSTAAQGSDRVSVILPESLEHWDDPGQREVRRRGGPGCRSLQRR